MTALEVGTRVRLTADVDTCPQGTEGVVVDTRGRFLHGYDVAVDVDGETLCFNRDEIEFVEAGAA